MTSVLVIHLDVVQSDFVLVAILIECTSHLVVKISARVKQPLSINAKPYSVICKVVCHHI